MSISSPTQPLNTFGNGRYIDELQLAPHEIPGTGLISLDAKWMLST